MSGRCWPWFWVLLGLLSVQVIPSVPPQQIAAADLRARVPHVERGPVEAEGLPVRELRQIPGIGQLRALAIARERWRSEREGQRFELQNVSGIGPAIAGQVEVWSAERAALGEHESR